MFCVPFQESAGMRRDHHCMATLHVIKSDKLRGLAMHIWVGVSWIGGFVSRIAVYLTK